VPQGSVLGPLLFLVYVNGIWRNINSSIRLFAEDCIICRKITDKNDIENLQKYLDSLEEWAIENWTKINPDKIRQYDLRKLGLKIQWVIPLVTKKFRNRAVVNIWK
jgi:hypothetical protein